MADSTIVLRSPVKSASSSLACSSPNSPTHHGTVIILKDNNSNDQKPLPPPPPPPRIPRTSSSTRNASSNHLSLPSLNAVQSKLYFAGHTGLYNLGNTCYVNCVLQLLSHVPQFCDAICSMSFESLGLEQPSDVPMVASSHNPTRLKGGGRGLLKAFEAQPRRVPCYLAYELHGTFNIIWSGKCMVYSPLNMVAAVRRLLPSFEPCAMEDAQEFLEALLAAVTDEIKANKLADSNVISDLLGFSSESQILCEQCHRLSVTKTDETFITLTFSEKMLCDSRGSTRRRSCHLTEMLAHFYQWEALSTPFQCSNCAVRSPTKEGTKAQKRLLISKLPQVLHVVLRRFRSLPQTHLRRPKARQARQLSHKITMHVNFDEYLDMAPYCAQPLNTSLSSSCAKHVKSSLEECFYRLRGVIVHYGKSINTGHFVAFVYNDTLGKSEWLRCDDHIIEQTTFESVKTSDAYILVYSRCASKLTPSSVLANASGEEKILNDTIASPVTCQLRKRKRAISVDQLNEQREDVSIGEVKNEMIAEKENFEKQFGLSKSLQFLCMNLGPLANGLRRRAQSLNFVIHSNQQSIVDSTQQTISTLPVTKRRRKEPIAKLSSSDSNSTQCVTTARSKPVSSSIRKPVISTRKKFSPPILMTNDLLSHPDKLIKTTRKRRRTDPFIRKRRLKQTVERKTQQKMNLSNLIAVPSIGQTLSPSESLVPSVQSPLSFTYETPINSTTPITKRIGRIRMQRCVDGPNTNATVRLISSGESHTRLSLPCQTTLQSSSLLTNLISARRSNSLNNTVSNPSSC